MAVSWSGYKSKSLLSSLICIIGFLISYVCVDTYLGSVVSKDMCSFSWKIEFLWLLI